MQISSRFTIALHIFACVDTFKNDRKVTSDFLAASINTNPVIIRRILTQLKKAGLIIVARGTGGIEVTRELSEISFYDVYQAIEPVEDGNLFRFHHIDKRIRIHSFNHADRLLALCAGYNRVNDFPLISLIGTDRIHDRRAMISDFRNGAVYFFCPVGHHK